MIDRTKRIAMISIATGKPRSPLQRQWNAVSSGGQRQPRTTMVKMS
jgi:hypothetical protein